MSFIVISELLNWLLLKRHIAAWISLYVNNGLYKCNPQGCFIHQCSVGWLHSYVTCTYSVASQQNASHGSTRLLLRRNHALTSAKLLSQSKFVSLHQDLLQTIQEPTTEPLQQLDHTLHYGNKQEIKGFWDVTTTTVMGRNNFENKFALCRLMNIHSEFSSFIPNINQISRSRGQDSFFCHCTVLH